MLIATTQNATQFDSDIIKATEVCFHTYTNTMLITHTGSSPVLGDDAIFAQACFTQYFQPSAIP